MNYPFDAIDMPVLFAIMVLALLARFSDFGRGLWPPR
jgi:hypothetical protein